MAKTSETVKYKMIVGRKYNVYAFEDGTTKLLERVETDGTRPRETDLCKVHNVKKVVLEEIEKTTKQYEMSISDFLAHATETETETK